MICARCHHLAAAPGGTLCTSCAAVPAPAVPAPAVPPYTGRPQAWLRSPVALGRAAAAMLLLAAAADLFAVWTDIVMYDVSGDLVNGSVGADVMRRADDADRLYAVAGVTQLVTLLASCVVFLCWFYRVRVNAEVFDPSGHSMKRGWAIGAWFTPVVNLWFPRRIAVDIWEASSPADGPRSNWPVNTWWTLWVIGLLAGRLADSHYNQAVAAKALQEAAGEMMFSDALDVVAAVFAVLVVLRLTRMQHEKALRGPAPAAA
ncbi:DUF4328 domain-containing protein [Streptomyces sp. 6-11-2]|uniref:DUF4328 domain-containing protein n=1 Tax=Streptomyces sp. 6-11-2 TaxID=2585753 RepID=UPI001143680E|nr:DUF4328 domain-containing protein [Streptomyces sp. 6-11-2]GED85188.1 hypothetical protein TNCT6_22730 [Streptomyces sp. 6-11-2]